MVTTRKRIAVGAAASAAIVLGLLASASTALASTAGLQKWGVEYIASPGEANRVFVTSTVQRVPVAIAIADSGAQITPLWPMWHHGGCERIGNPKSLVGPVWCELEAPDSMFIATLGDNDDRFFMLVPSLTTVVDGGPGDDFLFGGDGISTVRGSDGNDALFGGASDDWLSGGSGDDQLVGGPGIDDFSGDIGSDTADYSTRSAAVRVTLDTLPLVSGTLFNVIPGNDGEAGESDNVFMNVENVLGGAGADELLGSNGDNVLRGNDNDDWIVGYGGNDILNGGAGLDGLNGGDGDDTLEAEDGEWDAIDCGNGVDTVTADPFDFIIGGCEQVNI
jgi:RTX calcium-binding nonapeptide repeat (4 copies)